MLFIVVYNYSAVVEADMTFSLHVITYITCKLHAVRVYTKINMKPQNN